MKITVVVLHYKDSKNTVECVKSVQNSTLKSSLETIVVDNDSTDRMEVMLKNFKKIIYIKNKKNLGYAGGNNIGIKYALQNKTDYICVLNNDTKVDSFMLEALHHTSDSAIISPKIYFYPGYEYHKNRYKKNERGKIIWYAGGIVDWNNIIGVHRGVDEIDNGQYNEETETEYATGACLFANRDVFERVGLFDEKYFLYLEDMDLCVRAKGLGFKILYQPKAIMWHKNASSVGGSGSKLQDYYITRNRLLFGLKYASPRTKLALFRQAINQVQDPIKRLALFDFLTLNFGRYSHKKL